MRLIHFLLSGCAALVFGQDPYVLLPKNYSVEFENKHVRISRVRYFPGDTLPVHSHPSRPTVYVYLTDGGAIRFTHKTPKFTIERPAVKAGGVRFNRNAQVETHEVEYLGDTASEYLRVEMMTVPGAPHKDARLKADGDFPWEDLQVRIDRVDSTPGASGRPRVLIDVSGRSFVWLDAGKAPPELESKHFVVLELKTEPLPFELR